MKELFEDLLEYFVDRYDPSPHEPTGPPEMTTEAHLIERLEQGIEQIKRKETND